MYRLPAVILLVSLVSLLAAAMPVQADEGRQCKWLALNGETRRLYSSNLMSGNVSVIDLKDGNKIIATIATGNHPEQIAVNEKTNRVYVADAADGTLTVIDGEKNEIITAVEVGEGPYAVAVNPETNKIYVACQLGNYVTVVNGADNTVATTIDTGQAPCGLAVDTEKNRVFVSCIGGVPNCCVTIIDGESDQTVGTGRIMGQPFAVAVDPDNSLVFAVLSKFGLVSVLDEATGARQYDIHGAAGFPADAAIDREWRRLYIGDTFGKKVVIVDLTTLNRVPGMTRIGTLQSVDRPAGVVVDKSNHHVWVANRGNSTVTEIDPATGQVVSSIHLGGAPEEKGLHGCAPRLPTDIW